MSVALRSAAALVAILLASCAGKPMPVVLSIPPEPVVVSQPVNVPIAKSCLPADYQAANPDFGDAKAVVNAAPDVRELAKIIARANVLMHQRIDYLVGVLKGCS